jgi:chromosome segregation ATPase
LGLRLDKGVLTRNDALKDLANVADKLKQQLQDLGKKNPTIKALEHEARDPNSGSTSSAANQKQMDDLQKSLGKAGENPAALDKLMEKMQQVAKAAAGMPKDDSPAAAAERQKMAQSMSDLAEQARDLGQPLPNLEDAIAALQNSKTRISRRTWTWPRPTWRKRSRCPRNCKKCSSRPTATAKTCLNN